MNENLNLVEILKDYPKGTKLYSTIHGEVEFSRIDTIKMDKHPIVVVAFICGMRTDIYFTYEGKYLYGYDGECILFPSKDQRDWSKFSIEPKFDISTFQHFDKILVRDNNTQKWKCDFYDSYVKGVELIFRTTHCWYNQCIPYNKETKHLVSTTEMPPKKYITWEE